MDIKLKACRVCLITELKMYYIDNVLEDYLSQLAHKESSRCFPNYICYECKSQLLKFIKFRKKYILSQSILSNMYMECSEIKEEDIKAINHSTDELKSNLGYGILPEISLGKVANMTVEIIINDQAPIDGEIKPDVFIKPDIDEPEHNDDDQVLVVEDNDFNNDIKPFIDDNEPGNLDCSILVDDIINFENVHVATLDEQSDDMPIAFMKFHEPAKVEADFKLKVQGTVEEVEKQKIQPSKHVTPLNEAKEQKQPKPKRTTKSSKPLKNDIELEKYVTIIKFSPEEQLEELNKRKQSLHYLDAPYQCNLCYRGFRHTPAWNRHRLKHDPSAGDLVCPICKFRFKSKHILNNHVEWAHELKYVCKSCPQISTREQQAIRHQKWHEGVTYKCKHCDKVFAKWTAYLNHVKIKHRSEFFCELCGCSFMTKLGVLYHKANIHKDENPGSEGETEAGPYCKECDIKFVSVEAWNRHIIVSNKHKESVNVENLCRQCGKTFKTSEELQTHRKDEHVPKPLKSYQKARVSMTWPAKCEHCNEEIRNWRAHRAHYRYRHPTETCPLRRNYSYMCDICGNRYPTSGILGQHKRVHAEEKPFKCGACGRGFNSSTNLRTHKKQIHSELRPFPCTLCTKAFKVKAALNRHLRCHTGEKPYACYLCGKSFQQSSGRNLHVRTVHLKQPVPPRTKGILGRHKRAHSEEKPFKCDTCGKGYSSSAILKVHKTRTHSELRPFPCTLCTKAFKCKAALSRHLLCHTGEKPYSCNFCGKTFRQSSGRDVHVRGVHLKLPKPPRVKRRPAKRRTALATPDSDESAKN